jgi:hypothetical protein
MNMNKQVDPAVLERLRKILALANCDAATQGEVESALARAKELATKHNLELSTLDLSTPEKAKGAIDIEHTHTQLRTKYEQIYHRYIYNVINKVFGVAIIRSMHRSHGVAAGNVVVGQLHMIGDPFDVAIAKAVFPWLEDVFAKTYQRFVNEGKLTRAHADKHGCYQGIAMGIQEMNRREEAKVANPNAYALVVRSKDALIAARTAEIFPHMNREKSRPVLRSNLARELGYQEGSKINLKQVGSAKAAGAIA